MQGRPKRDSGWKKCRNLSSVSESLEECLGEWGREGPKQHFLSADLCQTLHLKVCIVSSNTEAWRPSKAVLARCVGEPRQGWAEIL